ncbi:MAG: hypothetical protein H6855_03535 [Rhodospirillales bacterium]|nr:hypothetical protein [Rhodospirillales bacterium]MCB9979585.1 hypothetical protein [Rhodospirillales bacterium]
MGKTLSPKGIIEVEQAKRDIAEIRAGEIPALDMFARILSIDGSLRMEKLQKDLGVSDRKTGGALTVAPDIYMLIARKAFGEYEENGSRGVLVLEVCKQALAMADGVPPSETNKYSFEYLAQRLREMPPASSPAPEV